MGGMSDNTVQQFGSKGNELLCAGEARMSVLRVKNRPYLAKCPISVPFS